MAAGKKAGGKAPVAPNGGASSKPDAGGSAKKGAVGKGAKRASDTGGYRPELPVAADSSLPRGVLQHALWDPALVSRSAGTDPPAPYVTITAPAVH